MSVLSDNENISTTDYSIIVKHIDNHMTSDYFYFNSFIIFYFYFNTFLLLFNLLLFFIFIHNCKILIIFRCGL